MASAYAIPDNACSRLPYNFVYPSFTCVVPSPSFTTTISTSLSSSIDLPKPLNLTHRAIAQIVTTFSNLLNSYDAPVHAAPAVTSPKLLGMTNIEQVPQHIRRPT
jgi:hypothetical protein